MKTNILRLTYVFFFFRGGEIKEKDKLWSKYCKSSYALKDFLHTKKQSEVIYGEIPSFKVGVI